MVRLADPQLALRRRREIMNAALACFRRRGFHQTTMQEICAEASISAGALYRYFAHKADIISAIAEDERSAAEAPFAKVGVGHSLIDALCGFAGAFFDKIEAGDGSLIADILAEAAREPAIAALIRDIDARDFASCEKAIKASQARGEVDPSIDAGQAANILFGAIEGIGLRRSVLGELDATEARAQFRALAMRYLAPPHEI
jgi:TetR/AcrR family transcriptional regulator, repressor for uid operon